MQYRKFAIKCANVEQNVANLSYITSQTVKRRHRITVCLFKSIVQRSKHRHKFEIPFDPIPKIKDSFLVELTKICNAKDKTCDFVEYY